MDGQKRNESEYKIVCGETTRKGMHAVSRFRRVVNTKISVEESNRCNIALECKRLKTVSKRKAVNNINNNNHITILSTLCAWRLPYVRCVLHTGGYRVSNW